MRCFTIGGEKPFQSWMISLHLPKRASSCATLLKSLFKCLIFQLLKQPARLKIPWARWPISSLFSFATILWTSGRESVSVMTCWSSSPLLAKSQLNPFRGSFPAYFTSGWFMEEIVGGLFIVLKQVWCKVPILGWSLALGFLHPLILAIPNWPCCHYHNFQILGCPFS